MSTRFFHKNQARIQHQKSLFLPLILCEQWLYDLHHHLPHVPLGGPNDPVDIVAMNASKIAQNQPTGCFHVVGEKNLVEVIYANFLSDIIFIKLHLVPMLEE